MEATIHGTDIRWIIPHSFTQYMPEDVDFRVMSTFMEFYDTLLNFVMFKLYNDIGVRYPFPLKELGGETKGSTSAILGANIRVLTNALDSAKGAVSAVVAQAVEDKSDKADNTSETSERKQEAKQKKELIKSVGAALSQLTRDMSDNEAGDDDEDDNVDIAGPLQAALQTVAEEEARASVPGGNTEMDDDTIKRRRLLQGLTFFLSREVPRGYLELVCLAYGARVGWEGDDSPISINDPSITHHVVDRPKLPSSYESLPKSREYIQPQWILDCANFMFLLPVAKYVAGKTLPPHLSPWVDDEEEGYKPAYAEEIERLKNGEVVDDAEEEMEKEDSSEEKEYPEEDIDSVEASEEEDGDEDEQVEKDEKRQERKRKKEDEEAHALAKSMMNRKAAHLYERMQHGIAKKQAQVDTLHKRRKELESTKGKDASGRTVKKQKVERLKDERKAIEDTYSSVGGTMKKSKKRRSS